MCRILALPAYTERKEAIHLLKNMAKWNVDGTGFVYIKNKQFEGGKWPKSLSYVLRKGLPFLDHLPHNGWTLIHLRAASHGKNTYQNTHPFIIGDWAVVHNGIWTEYNVVKLALSNWIKFKGETDSEVAAHLFNLAGPKKFTDEVDFSGVFLGLNKKTGDLWLCKTSGLLSMFELENKKIVLSTEFPKNYIGALESSCGWYRFDKSGKLRGQKKAKSYIENNHITEIQYGYGEYGGRWLPQNYKITY